MATSPAPAPPPQPKARPLRWVLIMLILLFGGGYLLKDYFGRPSIPFAPSADNYQGKLDLARVEHEYPLTAEHLAKLTPQNVANLTQEQVDQVYARITAGPIPDGAYDGDLFFPKGSSGFSRMGEILGGAKGLAAQITEAKLELLGRALWKGKVFYKQERVLRNRISNLEFLETLFPNQAEVAELKKGGQTEQLMFPAKLYCGQSLYDGRREAVIVDYAFTDELPGYRPIPDKLAGREGLLIRDEIRMVRPGFYLGRAYLNGVFGLNFTLENKAAATQPANEDCWVGTQRSAKTASP